jgi:hypothetical protein
MNEYTNPYMDRQPSKTAERTGALTGEIYFPQLKVVGIYDPQAPPSAMNGTL